MLHFIQQTLTPRLAITLNSNPDFLRDPIWGFIGVAIAIIFGFITLWLTWRQLQRKLLTYEVISANNILQIPKQYKNKIEIYFNSSIIQQLYVIQLKFRNKGNIPIEKSNFYESITIELGQNIRLFSAEILQQPNAKKGLEVSINQEPGQTYVKIEPFLLNVGELFVIQILADNLEDIKVFGRILGVNKILEDKKKDVSLQVVIIFLLTNAFISSIMLIISGLSSYFIK